jgi:four helix bundle protein
MSASPKLITEDFELGTKNKMQDFKKLKIWQKAHSLVLAVYSASSSFPNSELYGLTSQIRRSASSVPANIAEGCGRNGSGEFGRFLQIALGSTAELEYHLLLARDLNFLQEKDHNELHDRVDELRKMLISLVQKVKVSQNL